MEEKLTIEKLNDNNYGTWKFQMKTLLKAKGLFTIVDGTEDDQPVRQRKQPSWPID